MSSNADLCARCGLARREHVNASDYTGRLLCPTATFQESAPALPPHQDWTQRGMPSLDEIDAALKIKTWHEGKMTWLALLTRARAALARRAHADQGQLGLVPIEKMAEALDTYAEWNGAEHDNDCPGDDTCECKKKWVNDGVNAACRYLYALAKQRARETGGEQP